MGAFIQPATLVVAVGNVLQIAATAILAVQVFGHDLAYFVIVGLAKQDVGLAVNLLPGLSFAANMVRPFPHASVVGHKTQQRPAREHQQGHTLPYFDTLRYHYLHEISGGL